MPVREFADNYARARGSAKGTGRGLSDLLKEQHLGTSMNGIAADIDDDGVSAVNQMEHEHRSAISGHPACRPR